MSDKKAINASDIVNEVILRYPETVSIFNAFRIDSCCGGSVSIEKSATRDKVDINHLLSALNEKAIAKKKQKS